MYLEEYAWYLVLMALEPKVFVAYCIFDGGFIFVLLNLRKISVYDGLKDNSFQINKFYIGVVCSRDDFIYECAEYSSNFITFYMQEHLSFYTEVNEHFV